MIWKNVVHRIFSSRISVKGTIPSIVFRAKSFRPYMYWLTRLLGPYTHIIEKLALYISRMIVFYYFSFIKYYKYISKSLLLMKAIFHQILEYVQSLFRIDQRFGIAYRYILLYVDFSLQLSSTSSEKAVTMVTGIRPHFFHKFYILFI